eukprot:gnl/TRDRNA2_/TRDRNA2_171619_c0_seq11.p1 gnl/TRDRNA2_/TRDRNA2_171619_c0~~gnl/TRDRNA2_/TRDRNA2_171619_c0_seq11.p1  ORF type:complete len:261 (-),score=51.78 gnl/TRDRNA2_/TRDRNA2_171619_c0_seq11:353-1108(-)
MAEKAAAEKIFGRTKACVKIQAHMRGFLTRKKILKILEARRKESQDAEKIAEKTNREKLSNLEYVPRRPVGIRTSRDKEVDAALEAFKAAVDALSKLSVADKAEMKKACDYGRPGYAGLKLTAQAMCIMFGVKPVKVDGPDTKVTGVKVDDFWLAFENEILFDPRLIDRMVNSDRDSMPESVILRITPIYDDPEFHPDSISKSSSDAAVAFCKWVRAMVLYDKVAKEVAADGSSEVAQMAQMVLPPKKRRR